MNILKFENFVYPRGWVNIKVDDDMHIRMQRYVTILDKILISKGGTKKDKYDLSYWTGPNHVFQVRFSIDPALEGHDNGFLLGLKGTVWPPQPPHREKIRSPGPCSAKTTARGAAVA